MRAVIGSVAAAVVGGVALAAGLWWLWREWRTVISRRRPGAPVVSPDTDDLRAFRLRVERDRQARAARGRSRDRGA